jgi:hypothetical protein
MIEVNLERLRAHRNNIDRYRRLLTTHLSDLERGFIERRLSEEQVSVRALLQETLPDRLSARLPKIAQQEMAALLHPADAFSHPMDVVDDCDLTPYEKRAILSSWAADACAVAEPGRTARDTAVSFNDILDALCLLEEDTTSSADHAKGSDRHSGGQGPALFRLDSKFL